MIGTSLSHYEIVSAIGKGGMGEVWKAKDTKLGREVAIKTLPEEFSQDPDRLARFEREAKLLASLNHPNIAAIYGLEEHNGTRFLVLELVRGPTLEDRIKQGAIPVEESLKLALQIAEALEAAHEKGVIHRDLKPANVKVTPDGKVKVLDFGLAKAFEGDAAQASASNSPTLSMAATQAGIILGTAAYMSPEQASGMSADKRADIWSFGVVLFEMLTGRQMFTGKTASHVMGAVLNNEPEWASLPHLHPRVRLLLEACLEKEATDRLSGISDARVHIHKVLADPSGVTVQPIGEIAQAAAQSKLPWVVTIILVAAMAGVMGWTLRPDGPGPIGRFSHVLPEDQQFTRIGRPILALSPDGSRMVYVANRRLYLRAIDTMESTPVPGTDEDPAAPFFSPDGQWIGYWSGATGQLKKIAVSGGAPVALSDTAIPNGTPHWRDDGSIVWSEAHGVLTVSENGGIPEQLTQGLPDENQWGDPQVLLGGNTVLFSKGGAVDGDVIVQSFETGEQKVLFQGAHATYVSTGHILYGLRDVLFAVPFDLDTLEVAGGSVPLVEGVRPSPPQYAVSDSGSLVYVPGAGGAGSRILVLVDREGNADVLPAPQRGYAFPRFAPDDSRIAVQIDEDDGSNIWIYEIESGILNQLTFDGGDLPLWSPDGREVTFRRSNSFWTVPSDFRGTPSLLIEVDVLNSGPGSWSPDGTVLLFSSVEGIHAFERESASGEASEAAQLIIPSPTGGNISSPEFSLDGRWFVYASTETGRSELYVNPYPVAGGGRQRITTDGGWAPAWIRERQELIFQAPSGRLEAMDLTTEPILVRNNPAPLFSESEVGANLETESRRNFDASADGQRFVVSGTVAAEQNLDVIVRSPQINIVLNWFEELRERVPVP